MAALEQTGPSLRRRLLVRVAQVVVVAAAFAFLGLSLATNWSDLRDQSVDWRAEPGWFVLGVALFVVWYLQNAAGWILVCRALGFPLSALGGLAVWGQSLLGKYVPSSLPMIIGRCVLGARLGLPKRVGVVSILYEQAITLASGAAFAAVVLALRGGVGDIAGVDGRWVLAAIVPLAIAGCDPAIFGPIVNRILRRARLDPLPRVLSRVHVAGLLAYYTTTWLVLGGALWALLHAAVGNVDVAIWLLAAGYAVGYLASLVAFIAPSGIGVREAAFATVLDLSLTKGLATALAIGLRVFQICFELTFIAACAALGRRVVPSAAAHAEAVAAATAEPLVREPAILEQASAAR